MLRCRGGAPYRWRGALDLKPRPRPRLLSAQVAEAEERKHRSHDNNQAHDVDYVIHFATPLYVWVDLNRVDRAPYRITATATLRRAHRGPHSRGLRSWLSPRPGSASAIFAATPFCNATLAPNA